MKNNKCGLYQVMDKEGNPTAVVVFNDFFAHGFPNLIRIKDTECPKPMDSSDQQKPKDSEEKADTTPSKPSVKSYLAAEMSLFTQGPVSLPIYEERKQACMTCPERLEKPEKDEIGFCKACGCGERKRAGLSVKLHMPNATCPLNKWKPEKGEGVAQLKRIGGIVDQIKGVSENVKNEIKQSRVNKVFEFTKKLFKK